MSHQGKKIACPFSHLNLYLKTQKEIRKGKAMIQQAFTSVIGVDLRFLDGGDLTHISEKIILDV